jgi:hypothetical protein
MGSCVLDVKKKEGTKRRITVKGWNLVAATLQAGQLIHIFV